MWREAFARFSRARQMWESLGPRFCKYSDALLAYESQVCGASVTVILRYLCCYLRLRCSRISRRSEERKKEREKEKLRERGEKGREEAREG